MHASALESLLAYIGPGKRVLDIGSGSGYLTAVLGELVFAQENQANETGVVVGLEHIKELRDLGASNMEKSERGKSLLQTGKVRFIIGDGRRGYIDPLVRTAEDSKWDAIHVGAAAVTLHGELIEQLKSPGRIFIPVEDEKGRGQWIWVVDKDAQGKVSKERKEGVRYVPLCDAPK
jgi:protein-L-isoaspartate(D-aspartate) O-methyltransferase